MELFSIHQPIWLYLLWAIPVFLLVFALSCRKFYLFDKQLSQKPYLYQRKLPPWRHRIAKALFYVLGMAMVVVALADPHYQKMVPENIYKGVRIYFLFDVSRSMVMGEDVRPSRMAAAKEEIRVAYDRFGGAYEVALIPFADEANAYYHPPSFDVQNFYIALNELDEDTISLPGTNLVNAFGALNQLVADFGLRPDTVNIVVLLSDGGKEKWASADHFALQKEIDELLKAEGRFVIYAVGVGGNQPTPMVIRDQGGNFVGYLRDDDTGQIYTSQLDEETLKLVARRGGGEYQRFEKQGELSAMLQKVIEENSQLLNVTYYHQDQPIRLWFFLAGTLIFLFGETSFLTIKRKQYNNLTI
ncbi:MAG: vWA domain-containing protein [Patescibacteria group bacterium]